MMIIVMIKGWGVAHRSTYVHQFTSISLTLHTPIYNVWKGLTQISAVCDGSPFDLLDLMEIYIFYKSRNSKWALLGKREWFHMIPLSILKSNHHKSKWFILNTRIKWGYSLQEILVKSETKWKGCRKVQFCTKMYHKENVWRLAPTPHNLSKSE